MKKSVFAMSTVLLILACLAAPLAAQTGAKPAAQGKPVDMKKLLAEIAGEYDFSAQGSSLVVQFFEKDGKLFGAPPGETSEEIKPVEGKPLTFDVTVASNGQYYELTFVRNDKGVIDKCIMNVQGMTIEGVKVIK